MQTEVGQILDAHSVLNILTGFALTACQTLMPEVIAAMIINTVTEPINEWTGTPEFIIKIELSNNLERAQPL